MEQYPDSIQEHSMGTGSTYDQTLGDSSGHIDAP